MNATSGRIPFSQGFTSFSFRPTEPARGQYGESSWDGTGAGLQYSHLDSPSHGHTQNGFFFSSFSLPQVAQSDHDQSRAGRTFPDTSSSQWSTDFLTTPIESTEMSRFPSQNSTGAHSQRTANSAPEYHDHGRSMRLYSTVSQGSYSMTPTSPLITAGSASTISTTLCTPTQQIDLQEFDDYSYSSAEDLSGTQSLIDPIQGNDSMDSGSYNMLGNSADRVPPTFATKSGLESPNMWDSSLFLESQRSSPTLEDPWSQILTPTTSSPLDYSPSLEAQSSRCVEGSSDLADLTPYTSTRDRTARKPMGPRLSKIASDLASSRQQRFYGSETSEDSFKLVGRSSLEIDNTARDHPLYQNVAPQADGLYHCPWEGQSSCQHKPEKLKCNYDKFVDSHLKPYRCKVPACESLHFSSTACLLRHEREAHAMHGHGDKPFLCTYEHCERGVQGSGFPRHWNLRDHMKRVHGDPGPSRSNASNSPPPTTSGRGKKRKTESMDSPTLEDKPDVKKVATPPVVREPKPQEPSLLDHYRQTEQKLLETVKQLYDPQHAENWNLLRSASDCIKAMAHINRSINTSGVKREPASPSQCFSV